MLISIITVTYNSSNTIKDTLTSVASQSYTPLDHVIVDGASKDDTLKIVEQFPHVSQVLSEPDNGIYDAMNKGVKLAKGDVIGILNSDDFYANAHVLEKVADMFNKNPGLEACYADLQYVSPDNTQKVVRDWKAGYFKKGRFRRGWMPPHPTFFLRREVYDKFGLFRTDMRSSSDYELMLRFLYKNNVSVAYLPEVIVKMRTGGISNAALSNRLGANKEDYRAWIVNDLKPPFYLRLVKPLRKIWQFKILSL